VDVLLEDGYRARQEEAMIEQFGGPELADASELRSWREIRRAAVTRKLKDPSR
jgi:hypothetical protein